MQDASLITSAEFARIAEQESGRSCSPENVRRLARAGKLTVAAIVGNGQRLFHRDVAIQFGRERRGSNEAA